MELLEQEVVETTDSTPVETAVETPADVVEETAEETVDNLTAEGAEEAKAEEATEETTEESEVVASITFDATDTDEVFAEKGAKVLEQFDLAESPDLKNYIEALEAKVKTIEPPEIFSQISEYGDVEQIKTLLSEHNYLYSRREENGQYRPDTDKFAEAIVEKDRATADYLYFDLAKMPSAKYQGVTKFEEGLVEALARDGDTVNMTLNRYNKFLNAMRNDAIVLEDSIPAFIPTELHGAYRTLSKETREEIEGWDDDAYWDTAKNNKLNELRNIQKGINYDIAEEQAKAQAAQARQQKIHTDTVETANTFFDGMRKTMLAKLEGVQFSPDPKVNTMLAAQNVTLLAQAFSPESDGVFARQILADAGINFDATKAQNLLANLDAKVSAMVIAKNNVDANGNPLNPVDMASAQKGLEAVTREWMAFADDILHQQKTIVSGATKEAVEKAVEKRKVMPKARPATTGTAVSTKQEAKNPHIPNSMAWHEWNAERMMEAQARRAGAYQ